MKMQSPRNHPHNGFSLRNGLCGTCLTAIILVMSGSATVAEPGSTPLASIADHCGAPDPSQVTPEPDLVLGELAERLASSGWKLIGPGEGNSDTLEAIKTISRLELAPDVQISVGSDGSVTGVQTHTTSGRVSAFDDADPPIHLFVNETGEIVFVATFRYKGNAGIDLRCTAFGQEDHEASYLAGFEPQKVLSILRERVAEAEFNTMDIRNSAHVGKSNGHVGGEVEVSLINADSISATRAQTFPYDLRIQVRSLLNPPR